MPAATNSVRIKRSVLRVLVLTILSMSLYQLYWFYVTRKQLDQELGANASLQGMGPLLQTLGPLGVFFISIPLMIVLIGFATILLALIFMFVVWYFLLKDINTARAKAGLETTPPWLYIIGYIALSIVTPANYGVYGLVIYHLNQFWDKRTGGKAIEAPYTGGEIAVSLVGVLFFVTFIVLLAIGAVTAPQP